MARKTERERFEEAVRLIDEAKRSRSLDLDLSHLNLDTIPDSLAQLSNLQSLDLSRNQISTIPDSIAQLSNLQSLALGSNQISTIPDPLAQLSNLQTLDLSSNQISTIPDSLTQLSNLHTLHLYGNQISTIPDSLARLSNLQTLHLSSNQIGTIPDSLAQLSNLQSLHLYGNQTSTIPDFLAQLSNLQTLHLGNNQISTIPDSLAQLSNLQSLYLSDNQIRTIPDSLAQLSNLEHLGLRNNQISAIPDMFLQLKRLTRLYLHGNPGVGIPEEILGPVDKPKPAQEVLRYYFAQGEGSRPLNEAKLILVGTGGVGKTSLVNTLTTGRFNPREETTQGIKISDWPCPLGREDKVTVHVWDFGGQEMMHATHQFFLTARSLYLLVLSRRQGGYDEEADYWLRLIRAFGGKDAPVVVVLNKQKAEPFDVNRGGWLEKYKENIKGFVQTDCADSKSITLLKEAIEGQLRGMTSLKASFPARWFKIKDDLANMKTDYVSFEDYRAICNKYGEDSVESQNSLSGYLHDLGIALNYNQEHRVRFAYVLKPEWVTEGIYALLHAFVSSKGLFTPGEAERVLDRKRYSLEAVHFVLGLMEQFELSFPLSDAKNRILIPELLDDQQPPMAGEFKPADCLNFGYRYPIVPGGLLPRFIVRTHHLSDPAGRWKSGVILVDAASGCRALVRTDAAERQVRVHVDGPKSSRRDLLAIIRHNFDVIHRDYEFKPEELVYPAGVPDKPLGLEDLEILRRGGETTTQVVLQDKTLIKPEIAVLIQSVESPLAPVRIFLSYSHMDEEFVNELRKGLKVMERNGLIQHWYDRKLSAGEEWEPRILEELNEADVVICQLSRDFLASDSCVTELEAAIKRKEVGEAELIAYVLKDCPWKDFAKLKQLQMLPKDGKPLSKWRTKDEYWQAVADGIKEALKKPQGRPRKSRPFQ